MALDVEVATLTRLRNEENGNNDFSLPTVATILRPNLFTGQ